MEIQALVKYFKVFNTDATVQTDAQLRLSVLEIKPINRTNTIGYKLLYSA